MHIGDGEKGVAHSFFRGWIFRNILILLDRYALFKVLDKPGVNYSNKLLNIHQQDFCESLAGDYCLLAGHAIKGNVLSQVYLLTFRSAIHCVFIFGPLFIFGKALQS